MPKKQKQSKREMAMTRVLMGTPEEKEGTRVSAVEDEGGGASSEDLKRLDYN